jgi:hypothetical protein
MYARSRLPAIRRYETLIGRSEGSCFGVTDPTELRRPAEPTSSNKAPAPILIQGYWLKYDPINKRCYWEKAEPEE